MSRIDVTHESALPVDRLYAHLADHETVGRIFGARILEVRDGGEGPTGTGSVRRMRVAPLPPFEETVTRAVPGELIEYRITRGMPLMEGHRGQMRFTATPTGSRLSYVIELGSPVPLLDRVLARVLERNLRAGLATLEERDS